VLISRGGLKVRKRKVRPFRAGLSAREVHPAGKVGSDAGITIRGRPFRPRSTGLPIPRRERRGFVLLSFQLMEEGIISFLTDY